MNKIFVSFTIKGDNLNVYELSKNVPVHSDVFLKGESVSNKFNSKTKLQKTNRWVYSIESQEKEGLNDVLKRINKDLSPWIDNISKYTKKHPSLLDVVIYSNASEPISKFNVTLSKSSIKIINKLNARFSLTIFDW